MSERRRRAVPGVAERDLTAAFPPRRPPGELVQGGPEATVDNWWVRLAQPVCDPEAMLGAPPV